MSIEIVIIILLVGFCIGMIVGVSLSAPRLMR
jgi:hypothetical protein